MLHELSRGLHLMSSRGNALAGARATIAVRHDVHSFDASAIARHLASTARHCVCQSASDIPVGFGGEHASTYAFAFGSVPLGRSATLAWSPKR